MTQVRLFIIECHVNFLRELSGRFSLSTTWKHCACVKHANVNCSNGYGECNGNTSGTMEVPLVLNWIFEVGRKKQQPSCPPPTQRSQSLSVNYRRPASCRVSLWRAVVSADAAHPPGLTCYSVIGLFLPSSFQPLELVHTDAWDEGQPGGYFFLVLNIILGKEVD